MCTNEKLYYPFKSLSLPINPMDLTRTSLLGIPINVMLQCTFIMSRWINIYYKSHTIAWIKVNCNIKLYLGIPINVYMSQLYRNAFLRHWYTKRYFWVQSCCDNMKLCCLYPKWSSRFVLIWIFEFCIRTSLYNILCSFGWVYDMVLDRWG